VSSSDFLYILLKLQDLTKKTDELDKLQAEKESLEEKLLVMANLETELAKEKSEVARFSEENTSLTMALKAIEEDLKCSKSAFDVSQKELEVLNVSLENAAEEMQSLQKSNQELAQHLEESGIKLGAEIEASQKLKQLLEQEKYSS
jgi:chromosome segregation ATPase